MAGKLRSSDVVTVLRGLKAVARAASAVTEAELKEAWSSSSVRPVVAAIQDSGPARMVREAAGRSGAVLVGLKEYSVLAARGFPQVKPSHSGFQAEEAIGTSSERGFPPMEPSSSTSLSGFEDIATKAASVAAASTPMADVMRETFGATEVQRAEETSRSSVPPLVQEKIPAESEFTTTVMDTQVSGKPSTISVEETAVELQETIRWDPAVTSPESEVAPEAAEIQLSEETAKISSLSVENPSTHVEGSILDEKLVELGRECVSSTSEIVPEVPASKSAEETLKSHLNSAEETSSKVEGSILVEESTQSEAGGISLTTEIASEATEIKLTEATTESTSIAVEATPSKIEGSIHAEESVHPELAIGSAASEIVPETSEIKAAEEPVNSTSLSTENSVSNTKRLSEEPELSPQTAEMFLETGEMKVTKETGSFSSAPAEKTTSALEESLLVDGAAQSKSPMEPSVAAVSAEATEIRITEETTNSSSISSETTSPKTEESILAEESLESEPVVSSPAVAAVPESSKLISAQETIGSRPFSTDASQKEGSIIVEESTQSGTDVTSSITTQIVSEAAEIKISEETVKTSAFATENHSTLTGRSIIIEESVKPEAGVASSASEIVSEVSETKVAEEAIDSPLVSVEGASKVDESILVEESAKSESEVVSPVAEFVPEATEIKLAEETIKSPLVSVEEACKMEESILEESAKLEPSVVPPVAEMKSEATEIKLTEETTEIPLISIVESSSKVEGLIPVAESAKSEPEVVFPVAEFVPEATEIKLTEETIKTPLISAMESSSKVEGSIPVAESAKSESDIVSPVAEFVPEATEIKMTEETIKTPLISVVESSLKVEGSIPVEELAKAERGVVSPVAEFAPEPTEIKVTEETIKSPLISAVESSSKVEGSIPVEESAKSEPEVVSPVAEFVPEATEIKLTEETITTPLISVAESSLKVEGSISVEEATKSATVLATARVETAATVPETDPAKETIESSIEESMKSEAVVAETAATSAALHGSHPVDPSTKPEPASASPSSTGHPTSSDSPAVAPEESLPVNPTPAAAEPPVAPVVPVIRKRMSKLSASSKENTVPSSRIGRLASYGSLAAGLGMGALAEVARRTLGLRRKDAVQEATDAVLDASNPFLTEANAERIVNTLCKVRGAALKLGQMLSIQDNALVHPQLLRIFERVRQSADFMPAFQMEQVLVDQFGAEWRQKLHHFEDKPFAAASVGQVHYGVLADGREVAMKIQYPGVARGIESDINNLMAVMKVWKLVPDGLFVDEFVEVAKRELNWEVDYLREAESTRRFQRLLADRGHHYRVPAVVDELSSDQVITTEFVEGLSMEQCMELDQDTRNTVADRVLRLCLSELFEFQFMQTDPNWANFMFNPQTNQLVLLDFGASREYARHFVDDYVRVLEGAADGDRAKVRDYSVKLGFLSGYEAQIMEEAHVDAVMILGEAFRTNAPFDFGQQDTTRRIQKLIPVMLSQRLCPPPEESYSLHRKMSGAFLLCAKLGAKINCRVFFDEYRAVYRNLPAESGST